MNSKNEIEKEIIELIKEIGQSTLEENVYIIDYDVLVKHLMNDKSTANKVLVWLRQNGMIIDHMIDVETKRIGKVQLKVTKEKYMVRIP
jgi:hypothetical protein